MVWLLDVFFNLDKYFFNVFYSFFNVICLFNNGNGGFWVVFDVDVFVEEIESKVVLK